VAGTTTNELRVFDHKRRQHVRDMKDHTAAVNGCQLDGQRLVSCSADNTLKVWDLKTGKRLYSLLGGSLQARADNTPHPLRYYVSALVHSRPIPQLFLFSSLPDPDAAGSSSTRAASWVPSTPSSGSTPSPAKMPSESNIKDTRVWGAMKCGEWC
jgi:WD40 repeat protein